MRAEQTCAAQALACAEPMIGTAPAADRWIAIEENGPWNGPVPAPLDSALIAELDARVVLIRRPGRRRVEGAERQILAADAWSGRMASRTVSRLDELLEIDWSALEPADPVLLVCVHGRRDRCCAIAGRPVAAALAATAAEAVWECSHLGGHRFAPTALLLPYGYLYGGLTVPVAEELLRDAAAGRMSLRGLRGRSIWSAPGQAAELAVRSKIGELEVAAVSVRELDPELYRVDHQDGRSWLVRVEQAGLGEIGPVACGRPAEARFGHTVTSLVEV
jgi:hypothetical protein